MVADDVMFIVQNTVDVDVIDAESREVATLFVNMFISFSYPLNFIIYCCMSHQFRTQFAAMFCRHTQQSVGVRTDVTSSQRPSGRRQNSSVYELVGVSVARCESRDTSHVITSY